MKSKKSRKKGYKGNWRDYAPAPVQSRPIDCTNKGGHSPMVKKTKKIIKW